MSRTVASICAALLLLAATSFAQDHAPTVEQCRADQRLWWNQLDTQPEEISSLPFKKLNQRTGEMIACAAVDEERRDSYIRTQGMFQIQQSMRLLNFVERHNLMGQFLAEDKAGKR